MGKDIGSEALTMKSSSVVSVEQSQFDMFQKLRENYPNEYEKAINDFKSTVLSAEIRLVLGDPRMNLPVEQWINDHTDWSQNKSFISTRDHPALRNKPSAIIERFHSTDGLGYMQAPAVLQHYLVQMATNDPVPTLDVILYALDHMSPRELDHFLLHRLGQNSLLFLEKILYNKPKEYKTFLSHRLVSQQHLMAQYLQEYGPALVSEFHVTDKFKDPSIHVHVGQSRGKFLGMHSMLLIGYRKVDKSDSYRFLLQNWWKTKNYVEVDSMYLKSCRAIVRFVNKKQKKTGNFRTTDYQFAESDIDVAEESVLELEWRGTVLH